MEINEWFLREQDYDEEDLQPWEYITGEGETPETCPMGMFSPGTEQCDFCSWNAICAEEFHRAVNRS